MATTHRWPTSSLPSHLPEPSQGYQFQEWVARQPLVLGGWITMHEHERHGCVIGFFPPLPPIAAAAPAAQGAQPRQQRHGRRAQQGHLPQRLQQERPGVLRAAPPRQRMQQPAGRQWEWEEEQEEEDQESDYGEEPESASQPASDDGEESAFDSRYESELEPPVESEEQQLAWEERARPARQRRPAQQHEPQPQLQAVAQQVQDLAARVGVLEQQQAAAQARERRHLAAEKADVAVVGDELIAPEEDRPAKPQPGERCPMCQAQIWAPEDNARWCRVSPYHNQYICAACNSELHKRCSQQVSMQPRRPGRPAKKQRRRKQQQEEEQQQQQQLLHGAAGEIWLAVEPPAPRGRRLPAGAGPAQQRQQAAAVKRGRQEHAAAAEQQRLRQQAAGAPQGRQRQPAAAEPLPKRQRQQQEAAQRRQQPPAPKRKQRQPAATEAQRHRAIGGRKPAGWGHPALRAEDDPYYFHA